MTFLTPAALFGLLLIPALIALHLRRHQIQSIELPSLLLWENLGGEAAPGGKNWRIDQWLLLVLQLIVLCAIVLGLARPAAGVTAHQRVYVLDEGLLMTGGDPTPSRFAAAQQLIRQDIMAAPSGTSFVLVAADRRPHVVVSTTDANLAIRRLLMQQPGSVAADLPAALALAAGVVTANGHLLLVYAGGETLPALTAPAGLVSTVRVGTDTDDQGPARLSVRCVSGATQCGAFATIYNGAPNPIQDPLIIEADGTTLGRQILQLPAHSATDLSFKVPASRRVLQIYLSRGDLIAADNLAWSVIPANRPATVTVVGAAKLTTPLARAFAAVPDAQVLVRTPAQFSKSPPADLGLLVLAGWMPTTGLPAAPGLLLVDPPSFPGAALTTSTVQEVISGEDTSSPLLQGVDLTSLDIPPNAAVRVDLPSILKPVVWSPDDTLLAAGILGGRQVVTLAFDPTAANLSRLAAFPILIGNIMDWWAGWQSSTAMPGDTLTINVPPATDTVAASFVPAMGRTAVAQPVTTIGATASVLAAEPGIYTIAEHGTWGSRSAQVAVSAFTQTGDAQSGAAITIPRFVAAPGVAGPEPRKTNWWPWLGVLAGMFTTVEALLIMAGLRRRA